MTAMLRSTGFPGPRRPSGSIQERGGSVTKKMLPAGKPVDVIDGVDVSCVDIAMPVVLMRAEGVRQDRPRNRCRARRGRELLKRMETIRCKAGALMGMGDVAKSVVPKMALLSAPRNGAIASRFFVPKPVTRRIP